MLYRYFMNISVWKKNVLMVVIHANKGSVSVIDYSNFARNTNSKQQSLLDQCCYGNIFVNVLGTSITWIYYKSIIVWHRFMKKTSTEYEYSHER